MSNPTLDHNDLPMIKDFYRQARKLVQMYAPQATFVFHDSNMFEGKYWNDLFKDWDMQKVAMDHHFFMDQLQLDQIEQLCYIAENEAARAQGIKYPVWFGEWSLGTDTCLLWIGGFNDGFIQPPTTC